MRPLIPALSPISAKLFLPRRDWKKWTSNIERPTSNVEWEKMKKQTYDLEERLLEYSVRIIKIVEQLPNTRAGNHVAGQLLRSGTSPYPNHGEAQAAESPRDEWTSNIECWMRKDEEAEIDIQVLTSGFWKQMKLNCGATSLFDVQPRQGVVRCSAFVFQNNPVWHKCNLWTFTK